MSRRILTEELDRATAQHALWLQTAGRQGKRINFSGCLLNGRNLRGLDLRGAILRGVQLSWADLRQANLCASDLCGAVMDHALLVDAALAGANLSGANLHRADVTGAEFSDAILLYSDMTGAICRNEQPAEENAAEHRRVTVAALARARASRVFSFGVESFGRLTAAGARLSASYRWSSQQRLPAKQLLLAKPETINAA